VRRSDRDRLDDIAEALRAIRTHVAATSNVGERLTRDAVLYNLLIIGEAVKALSEETKADRPEIPWREIAGLRDLLAHEYFRIDIGAIQQIIARDLGPLEKAVRHLRGRAD
jgi:uncharacterized protein with HEPN domain